MRDERGVDSGHTAVSMSLGVAGVLLDLAGRDDLLSALLVMRMDEGKTRVLTSFSCLFLLTFSSFLYLILFICIIYSSFDSFFYFFSFISHFFFIFYFSIFLSVFLLFYFFQADHSQM